jgi:hypothetical protein
MLATLESHLIQAKFLTASLAVASTSPSGLNVIARSGELCAGMMLMLPVSSSITCTCPGDRPGKASIFWPRQASPSGLSEVSNTDNFCGGVEKANTWTLFKSATTILDLERRTPRTEVRNSRVMAGFCFASSQMTS